MKHFLYIALALSLIPIVAQAQSWSSMSGPQVASNVRDISVTNGGATVFCADNNYVLKSTNSGSGWAVTPQTYSNPILVLVKPSDSTIVLAAKNGEMRYNSSGGGGSGWTNIPNLTDLTPLRLIATTTDNGIMLLGRTWVTGNNAIWRSSNSGQDWSKVTNFTDTTNIHDFASYPIEDPAEPERKEIIWAAGSHPSGTAPGSNQLLAAKNRGVWVSHNYGVNWTASTLGDYEVRSVAIVDKAASANYHLYAACSVPSVNDTLFKSTNLAGAWTPIFYSVGEIRMVRYDRGDSTIFLATNDGVYRSTNAAGTNGGGTWTKMTNFPENDVKSIAIGSGQTVFAGTANSLYKSTNNGSDWTNVGDMNVSSIEAARAMKREGSLSGND